MLRYLPFGRCWKWCGWSQSVSLGIMSEHAVLLRACEEILWVKTSVVATKNSLRHPERSRGTSANKSCATSSADQEASMARASPLQRPGDDRRGAIQRWRPETSVASLSVALAARVPFAEI